jgi:hypothetical protein
MTQTKAVIEVLMAVADAIKELKAVPSGHLYAALMGKMDIQSYEAIIRTLVNTKLVARRGDLLVWVG